MICKGFVPCGVLNLTSQIEIFSNDISSNKALSRAKPLVLITSSKL